MKELLRKEKQKLKKGKSGITLIALVVTIIVLLILAGISIGMLTGNNGILKQARNAKTETIDAGTLEQIKIEILGSFNKKGYLDLAKLTTNLQSIGATVTGSSFPITVTFNGLSYTINSDGTIGEREYVVAWVYKNLAWSNPYFKDATLENDFNSAYSEWLDTDYSITSEDELNGQIVVKLYDDGELKISGEGDIICPEDPGGVAQSVAPWKGAYHWIENDGVNIDKGYDNPGDDPIREYYRSHIQKIVIDEGIVSIPAGAFADFRMSTVEFPSTITSIGFMAFFESTWLRNLYLSSYYVIDPYVYVDVVINGETFPMICYQND